VTGVDCKLDGFNVTIEALKNIVTDKPAPITKPLESLSAKNLVLIKNDKEGESEPDEEAVEKAEKNAKLTAKAAFDVLGK